jgi:hypothetical protein
MFTKKTALILGAGASVDYGYPLGSELLEKIIQLDAGELYNEIYLKSPVCENLGWSDAEIRHIVCLQEALKKNRPQSIDRFLGENIVENWRFYQIAKFCISYILVQHEYRSPCGDIAICGSGGWYKFLFDKIIEGCMHPLEMEEVFENYLSIVTFNYDVSLENYFYNGVANYPEFCQDGIESALQNSQFIFNYPNKIISHVYGFVYPPHFFNMTENRHIHYFKNHGYGRFGHRSRRYGRQAGIIRELFQHAACSVEFELSGDQFAGKYYGVDDAIQRSFIKSAQAERVFMLGFGFDEFNNKFLINAGINKNKNNLENTKFYITNYKGDVDTQKRIDGFIRQSGIPPELFYVSNQSVFDAFKSGEFCFE